MFKKTLGMVQNIPGNRTVVFYMILDNAYWFLDKLTNETFVDPGDV